MAAKKKTAAKKTTAKKKAALRGKRYTDSEKAEVLAFVVSQGRGGQSKASAKFGVSALTISNWRKKAGSAGKATKAAKPSKKGGDAWSAMVALKKDIDIMEGKVAAKKAEFSKLAGQL